MSEIQGGAHGHASSSGLYTKVFIALCIVTFISVASYYLFPAATSAYIIMAVSVVKAVLVAVFFMHLSHDWGRVYFLIIPAFILVVLIIIVLLPDLVLAWHLRDAFP